MQIIPFYIEAITSKDRQKELNVQICRPIISFQHISEK